MVERPTEPSADIAEEPADTIPVLAAAATPTVDIIVNGHDAELEFELSEIERDRQTTDRLRNELVYVTPTLPLPIDLSGDEPIWNSPRTSVA